MDVVEERVEVHPSFLLQGGRAEERVHQVKFSRSHGSVEVDSAGNEGGFRRVAVVVGQGVLEFGEVARNACLLRVVLHS